MISRCLGLWSVALVENLFWLNCRNPHHCWFPGRKFSWRSAEAPAELIFLLHYHHHLFVQRQRDRTWGFIRPQLLLEAIAVRGLWHLSCCLWLCWNLLFLNHNSHQLWQIREALQAAIGSTLIKRTPYLVSPHRYHDVLRSSRASIPVLSSEWMRFSTTLFWYVGQPKQIHAGRQFQGWQRFREKDGWSCSCAEIMDELLFLSTRIMIVCHLLSVATVPAL